jgi:hypothetical protein
MKIQTIFATAFSVAALGAAGQAAAANIPLYSTTPSQVGDQYLPGFELGLDFVSNKNTVINGLGAFTNGNSAIKVNLWDITAGNTLVASTTVTAPSGSSRYVYNPIGPMSLVAGDTYQVEAAGYTSNNKWYNPDQPGGAGPVGFNQLFGAYTEIGAYFYRDPTYASSGIVPANLTVATTPNFDINNLQYGFAYGAGSITSAPEPATWLLMIAGVGMMGAALRYRRKTGVAALAIG